MYDEFLDNWMTPFYLNILHGNYATLLNDAECKRFNQNVTKALAEITPEFALRMIDGDSWREPITGSWFAGLKLFDECQIPIGEKLITEKQGFAGQSYAFAMACYANQASTDYLVHHLDENLRTPDPECWCSQDWTLGALMWLDQEHKTAYANQFLVKDGLWDRFTMTEGKKSEYWNSERLLQRISILMHYCQTNFQRPAR